MDGIIEHCDYVFMSRWSALQRASATNRNCYFLQECVDPAVNYPIEVPYAYDVSFIGSLNADGQVHADRERCHAEVGFEVVTNAFGLEHSRVVSQTRINLNFTEGDGTSDRLYKILAAEGFLLTQPYTFMTKDFVPGEHLETFESTVELKQKIAFYLRNSTQREAIAVSGRRRVGQFTTRRWAETVLSTCGVRPAVGTDDRLGGHVEEYLS